MARGITEDDVHQAADALVAGGERPTVDRIRSHLGTGSPNTVTRWLETWWQGLGARLSAQQMRLAAPDAPDAVATLAGQWWALALEAAKASLQTSLADEQAAVESDRVSLRAAREALDTEAATLRAQAEAAGQAEHLAAAHATELQRLVTHLEAQVEELSRQRDAAATRETEREVARQALEARLQVLQASAEAERDGLLQHIRAVEGRANTEIDRARQESKELQVRLGTVIKDHASVEKMLRQAADQARASAVEGIRDASIERARADALEKQLSKLQDLPAALEAAMRQTRSRQKQPKSGSAVAVRAAGKRAKGSSGACNALDAAEN